MCLDSVEYAGLIRLYTDYEALKQINDDLKHRFNLLDDNYVLCQTWLKTAENSLILVNNSRDSLLIQNKQYFEKATELNRQLKNCRIFGTIVSISLIGVITLLLI
jgi:hypothetical protein